MLTLESEDSGEVVRPPTEINRRGEVVLDAGAIGRLVIAAHLLVLGEISSCVLVFSAALVDAKIVEARKHETAALGITLRYYVNMCASMF